MPPTTCLVEVSVKKNINPCFAELIFEDVKLSLHFISFIKTEMPQVLWILHHGRQTPHSSQIVNALAVDDLATQEACASAAMVLTHFPQDIPVSAPEGLTIPWNFLFWIVLKSITCIYILRLCSTLKWDSWLKFNLIEDNNVQNQYHICWWPCDASSQGLSHHDTDLVMQIMPHFARRVNLGKLDLWPIWADYIV